MSEPLRWQVVSLESQVKLLTNRHAEWCIRRQVTLCIPERLAARVSVSSYASRKPKSSASIIFDETAEGRSAVDEITADRSKGSADTVLLSAIKIPSVKRRGFRIKNSIYLNSVYFHSDKLYGGAPRS